MNALFLDRDGVINIEKEGSYILNPSELHFYEGALEAIAKARQYFGRILVVTNQRGIGKGLMTETDLQSVHDTIQEALKGYGGSIDRFYHAPALHSDDPLRKPNTGMAELARQEFPEINFAGSVMIGNNYSDMQFGKRMGMKTIFLHTTNPPQKMPNEWIDEQYDSLSAWLDSL